MDISSSENLKLWKVLVGRAIAIPMELNGDKVKVYSSILKGTYRIPWNDCDENLKSKYFEAENLEMAIQKVRSLLEKVISKAKEMSEKDDYWNSIRELENETLELKTIGYCPAFRKQNGVRYCAIRPTDIVEDVHCPFQGEITEVKLITNYNKKKELAMQERYKCLLFR